MMALADYINNKPTIETDRLAIRPMTAEDVSDLKLRLLPPLPTMKSAVLLRTLSFRAELTRLL